MSAGKAWSWERRLHGCRCEQVLADIEADKAERRERAALMRRDVDVAPPPVEERTVEGESACPEAFALYRHRRRREGERRTARRGGRGSRERRRRRRRRRRRTIRMRRAMATMLPPSIPHLKGRRSARAEVRPLEQRVEAYLQALLPKHRLTPLLVHCYPADSYTQAE
jgi:hypothetical protein